MSSVRDSVFNGGQMRLARHYLGLTLQDIADIVGKTRQFISQLETGKAKPGVNDPIVDLLAEALKVRPSFLFSFSVPQIAEEQAHFRKLATTKASTRQTVLARGSIFDQVVEYIDRHVKLPIVDFPDYSGFETAEEIERASERLRAHWGLGLGPISHMVRVVERAGAVVAFFREASTEVDALSITSRRPVIVRNDAKRSPFRQRFDIAHELGHLVLHEGHVTGDRKTETEANRFASAFLLPRSTFLKAFPRRGGRLDWSGIRDLKLTFMVSKAAILYRAKSLGLIDDAQYLSAVITLKNRGEAIEEAEDALVVKEDGEVVVQALQIMKSVHGIGFSRVANDLGVLPDFLSEIIPAPIEESMDVGSEGRVMRPFLRVVDVK